MKLTLYCSLLSSVLAAPSWWSYSGEYLSGYLPTGVTAVLNATYSGDASLSSQIYNKLAESSGGVYNEVFNDIKAGWVDQNWENAEDIGQLGGQTASEADTLLKDAFLRFAGRVGPSTSEEEEEERKEIARIRDKLNKMKEEARVEEKRMRRLGVEKNNDLQTSVQDTIKRIENYWVKVIQRAAARRSDTLQVPSARLQELITDNSAKLQSLVKDIFTNIYEVDYKGIAGKLVNNLADEILGETTTPTPEEIPALVEDAAEETSGNLDQTVDNTTTVEYFDYPEEPVDSDVDGILPVFNPVDSLEAGEEVTTNEAGEEVTTTEADIDERIGSQQAEFLAVPRSLSFK